MGDSDLELETIVLENMTPEVAGNLIGPADGNIRALSDCFDKDISFRDNTFYIRNVNAEEKEMITEVVKALAEIARRNQQVSERDVLYAYQLVMKEKPFNMARLLDKVVGKTLTGKPICPKTQGQLKFIEAMEKYDIVFAIGPAGTGKTYLAVIYAVSMLKKGLVKRIVLTRPAVEAGESLGFLPGDLKEKVDPYLTPLYDALHVMLGAEATEKLIEKKIIEVAPLAYMRGRTLDDAFVILDEAQNTTSAQMKMFLTRLGFNSKMVITGDITQIDLGNKMVSGLKEASRILSDIDDIRFLYLNVEDVVRHPLVQKIIESYEHNQ